jgi:CRP/FNR family cyclic AMP-dependent transcriptional regulator
MATEARGAPRSPEFSGGRFGGDKDVSGGPTARLLDSDPALAEGLSPQERAAAADTLAAPLRILEKGPWQPEGRPQRPGHFGFLIVDGLLVRRVVVGTGSSAELLAAGDLLWPWDEEASSFATTSWEVLERTTLLVLGPPLAQSVARWPAILANLVIRGTRRSRALAADAALASVVGIRDRVLILLWQIAERWGEVRRDGIRLTIRLPHRILAELVGARRPSVTSALAELHQDGRLATSEDGSWVLLGDPPTS